jgi:23S rRNA (pseudouridine1915-N3)-methyltransferase
VKIQLLCVSKRPSAWVLDASNDYVKRLQGKLEVNCRELSPVSNVTNEEQQREREGEMILKAIPSQAHLVALDERGKQWSTAELATAMQQWQLAYKNIALVIGGAEGLAQSVRNSANHVWSLAQLTLPHQLVRVIVIEQIYRAWSLLNNHPYHRA